MEDNKALAKAEDNPSALTIANQNGLLNLNLQQIQSLAKAMAISGMFQDIGKDSAKAFVKILAGQEMGIPPFQALSDIHIIQGKATAGGNIYAAKLKQSPKYDYRVKSWTAKGCAIEFYERVAGKLVPIGTSQFDENDARKAGLLSNPTWSKFPRNMYFNRAMTNGVRTFCPDALGGVAAYTPDELTGGRDYIEVEQTQNSETEQSGDTPQEAATEDPEDSTLLEEDKDPDMPPDFLKYDDARDEAESDNKPVSDAELNGPLQLPDLDAKAKVKR